MLRRRASWAALLLISGAVLGAAGGIYADQAFPDRIPAIGIRSNPGRLDDAQLQQALRIVRAHYYDPRLDYDKLSDGTVRGLVQSLGDPYSQYFDPQQYTAQQAGYAGRHTGVIGIYVSFDGKHPTVSGLVPGGPAQKAGMRAGDIILSIDGHDTSGLDASATAPLIRGPVGSSVHLEVGRGGSTLELDVSREDFSSPMVVSTRIEQQVLYMRIYQFGDQAQAQFDDQLRAGLAGARGVVLDLRDNPGGFVTAAAAVISRFVDNGEAFEVRDRTGATDRTDVSGDHPGASLPLVVLVNGSTASAAEIVAGSLQSHHRARLVGAKTFGKGSVQVDYPLPQGADLHLTVQHWFLPDGRSVDKVGLQPDVAVALASRDQMFDVVQADAGHAADGQLNRALELLAATSAQPPAG